MDKKGNEATYSRSNMDINSLHRPIGFLADWSEFDELLPEDARNFESNFEKERKFMDNMEIYAGIITSLVVPGAVIVTAPLTIHAIKERKKNRG